MMKTKSLVARFAALRAAAELPVVPVLVIDCLTYEALLDLVHGKHLAVRVPEFIHREHCAAVAERLLATQTWGNYTDDGVTGIEISGNALFNCGGNRACPEYFRYAVQSRRAVRELIRPLASPIDIMQAELDTAWIPGARVLTLDGKKCHVGLQRCFHKGGGALEHTDRARVDFVHSLTAEFQFQLALNTYLKTAEGGELDLWNIKPTDEEYELARNKTGATYALRADVLPEPDVTIVPQAGDLVIFNAAKVHRVRPVGDTGARVTVSSFSGYVNEKEPLYIFS